MKFLYPEFLWAFAILIIPIVIHLFNFKRYKTLYFSSLTFVKHIDQQTKSTQKLKHLLVLSSRLLAFTFLVLAFAQPYFSHQNESSKSKNNIIAFYIDNSFSMQALGANGELLSQARENARDIIKKAPLSARFMIVTNSKSGSEERILSKIEALEKLDKIDFSPLIRSIDEILNWQTERINSTKNIEEGASIQHILFSDFQSNSAFRSKKIAIEKNSNSTIFPIKLTPESDKNLFIDSIWFTSPLHKLNTLNELNIQINNPTSKNLKNIEIDIKVGDYSNSIFIDLGANQKTITEVGFSDKSIGYKQGIIRMFDNRVNFDDTYYLSYEVRQNVNILLLDGEDAVDNIETVLSLDEFYNTTRKRLTSITREDLEQKDLIILNGANSISKGAINYISSFASTGGTISLYPGKNPNKSEWNELLSNLNLPLLGSSISSGNKIKTLNYNDPFFKGIFETQSTNLNLPSVSKTFSAIKNNTSIGNNLIELQNGLPLLIKNEQAGNSFMFYSSLHSDFGSFTKNALFAAVTLRTSELSQRNQPEYMTIGNVSRFPIYSKIEDDNPIHIKNKDIDFIPQTEISSGIRYISLNDLNNVQNLISGNYDLKTDKLLGGLSLNYDRTESILSSLNEQEIANEFKKRGINDATFNEVNGTSKVAMINIEKPFSYWKLCIILTLIFVLLEMIFVRFLK
ncbi:MAG: BatA domain-containing protein [Crocinitomicaceae bacterium]|nr:BatA domain-containing protein [Crocinitomicaceae bacterium]